MKNDAGGDAGMQILTWIFHAARPLQMDELRIALDVEDEDPTIVDEPQLSNEDIIEMCQSLVVFEESSGVVRFVHPTVQEFLVTCNLSDINVARTCLIYLEKTISDDINLDEGSMDIQLKEHRFCRYSAQFWGFHLRGEAEELPEIQKTVNRLLSSEGRRNFLAQMKRYLRLGRFYTKEPRSGQAVLHIMAANGLAFLCRKVLEITLNHETYTFVVDETDSEKFTVHFLNARSGVFEYGR
jgi:hypothetical protein